jgi:uncharacterized protein (DUF3084 family)
MMYVLGILTGIAISALILATLIFFKRQVMQITEVTEKKIESAGPRMKGQIFMPQDESEDIRQEIIEKNRSQGKDTPIKDLI